jgi:hypothetical protein
LKVLAFVFVSPGVWVYRYLFLNLRNASLLTWQIAPLLRTLSIVSGHVSLRPCPEIDMVSGTNLCPYCFDVFSKELARSPFILLLVKLLQLAPVLACEEPTEENMSHLKRYTHSKVVMAEPGRSW